MTNRELLKGIYTRLTKKLGRPASTSDLQNVGVTRSMIRHHYGNMTNLQKASGVKQKGQELESIYKALGVKNGK